MIDKNRVKNSESEFGLKRARVGFAAIFVAFAYILMFLIPMAFILVTSIVLLPISIRNRNVETKWIRILSYVFDGVLVSFILFDVFKFVLIRMGIG